MVPLHSNSGWLFYHLIETFQHSYANISATEVGIVIVIPILQMGK